MFRWSVLLGALVVTAPTIWAAFGAQTVDVTSALVHYLVAVPIIAVLFALVRTAGKRTPVPPPAKADRSTARGPAA